MAFGRDERSYRYNGEVFVYDADKHKYRLGNGTRLKLLTGDLCMVTGHTGDCFHTYVLLRKVGAGLEFNNMYMCAGTFSAYEFGTQVAKIGKLDFHLVQAGFNIKIHF
mgnify:CR=1 FL=1